MKIGWIVGLVIASATMSQAAPVVAGPSGGRLLGTDSPRAEFFVNAERKVEIRWFDDQMKAVPIAEQSVAVIAEAPSGKSTLSLESRDGALVSSAALPEGDGYNVVVQVRRTADAKPQNYRVPLHLETCGGCQRAEYACTCEDHGEAEGHGHAH